MASNYNEIAKDQSRLVRTIENSGRLLAGLYAERTHFLFELLQNAEDALARRSDWRGSRTVSFDLTSNNLRVSHFGSPFDEEDVLGICSIGESAKELTAIGRFGIGFKSVYAVTERPEVHSGGEDFAIESFVRPVAVPKIARHHNETVILLPFNSKREAAHKEISGALKKLGTSTLLFLREIEQIDWRVEGGRAGSYRREVEEIDKAVRRVTLVGQDDGGEDEETWLVFSKPVKTTEGDFVGYAEIAFATAATEETDREEIELITASPLVVFFPTVLETHLGFLLQGPYRTTPSRDNVPPADPWNQRLVRTTASLLVDALKWFRKNQMLTTRTLQCLPVDPTKFGNASMFAPIFFSVKDALSTEALLPRSDSGHLSARKAKLARTQELRDLLSPAQLTQLLNAAEEVAWLSSDITQDRTPGLRRYLIHELEIAELTAEGVTQRLSKGFLEKQSDAWIRDLYEFLARQPALKRLFADLPLVRLEDRTHVMAFKDGQPQAFLPGSIKSDFPTVRRAVCSTQDARGFLQTLGLTEPDPVDDVVRNVVPRYTKDDIEIGDSEYEADLGRILKAFATDSNAQRDKLIAALQEASFVKAVDPSNGSTWFARPSETYLATETLKELFEGVTGVLIVDDQLKSLRGEQVRDLLETCGAARNLELAVTNSEYSWQELLEARRTAGLERANWTRPITDHTLRGLDGLLTLLPKLEAAARQERAGRLWIALSDLANRRGARAFVAEYSWGYSHETKTALLDAWFVRRLNDAAWVPDGDRELQAPRMVLFKSLGWKENPVLESKIHFKPPILDTLAEQAGIEPGLIDLLRRIGLTSEAELRRRLQLEADSETSAESAQSGGEGPTTPHADPSTTNDQQRSGSSETSLESAVEGGGPRGADKAPRTSNGKGRTFISYVAVQAENDDEQADPDGLTHAARMALEAKAIELILKQEPLWQRTRTNNPGYDLHFTDDGGHPTRWCEVKAMTGSLQDRPVGLSRTQFESAQEHGDDYWLYIVENAGNTDARIIRIQNPAGKAQTFTFDHGWIAVADQSDQSETQPDT